MKIANKTVLITGANRGVGHALVNEALRRGVGICGNARRASNRRIIASRP
jgi:NAD(P)-dependent dehydrogenase (short-subunit alcohol dehydrogenase family)